MRISSSFPGKDRKIILAQKVEEAQRIVSDHSACADLQGKKSRA